MYSDVLIVRRVQKKINCKSCGYFDGMFCRVGLGWNPPKRYCPSIHRIQPKRCGRCKYYSLNQNDRSSGHCHLHNDFRNFFDCCLTDPGFVESPEKDLRLRPEPIPQVIKDYLYEQKRRGIGVYEKYFVQDSTRFSDKEE